LQVKKNNPRRKLRRKEWQATKERAQGRRIKRTEMRIRCGKERKGKSRTVVVVYRRKGSLAKSLQVASWDYRVGLLYRAESRDG